MSFPDRCEVPPSWLRIRLIFVLSLHLYDVLRHEAIVASGKISTWSTLDLIEFRSQLRQGLVEIGHKTIVGHLEDRRLLILVDSNNHLRIFHPSEMLYRSRNTNSDIKFGCDHLAGLAHLPIVRRIAGINGSTRGAHSGAELVCDRLDVLCEVLPALHRAATGNDDLGRGQLRPVGF